MTLAPKTHYGLETVNADLDDIRWLRSINTKNRPFSKAYGDDLAAEMDAGFFEWKNGETFKIGWDGTKHILIDAQHRAYAAEQHLMRKGGTVPVSIAWGLTPRAFWTIDQQKKRNIGDLLAIHGDASYTYVGQLTVYLHRWEHQSLGTPKYPKTLREKLDTRRRHPDSPASVEFALSVHNEYSPMPVAVCALLHYVGSRIDKQSTEEFLSAVASDAKLEPDSMALLLRRELQKHYSRSKKHPHKKNYPVGIGFKALKALLEGRTLKVLKLAKREEFPLLAQPPIPTDTASQEQPSYTMDTVPMQTEAHM